MNDDMDLSPYAFAAPMVAGLLPRGFPFGEYFVMHGVPQPGDELMAFRVVRRTGWGTRGNGEADGYACWMRGAPCTVDNPYEADIFAEGAIRRDGHAWLCKEGEAEGMMRFRGYREAADAWRLMASIYGICAELMPDFDQALAGMPYPVSGRVEAVSHIDCLILA